MKTMMPAAMLAMCVAPLAMALICSMTCRDGFGAVDGIRIGALIGVFAVCAFVIHNYVNLNIGLTLTGLLIGLIYSAAFASPAPRFCNGTWINRMGRGCSLSFAPFGAR